MKQKVMVLSTSGKMARVSYHRPTACHGDCSKCAGGLRFHGGQWRRHRFGGESRWREDRGFCVYRRGDQEGGMGHCAGLRDPRGAVLAGYFLGQHWGHGNLIGVLGFFLGLALAVLEVGGRKSADRRFDIRLSPMHRGNERDCCEARQSLLSIL